MRPGCVCLVLAAFLLLAAAPADGRQRTLKLRYGPITTAGYEVKYGRVKVPAPRLDGFVTRMYARTVDAAGRPVPVSQMMLHHVAFLNLGSKARPRRDTTYCPQNSGQRFYGTGEEDQALSLPAGYGYPIARDERWVANVMYMNHRRFVDRAWLEYTVTIDDNPRLTPVTPHWIGVTPCVRDPIFDVPGGAAPGEVFVRNAPWTVPRDGRIVAAGGHIHGGARDLFLSEPRCGGRTLVSSKPLYGFDDHPYYNVLPVLHEPGPISTSWTESRAGIQVRRGETLTLTALYDAARMHVRAMGILHVYLAPGLPERADAVPCAPLPADVMSAQQKPAGRALSPDWTVPLTGIGPDGRATTIERPPGATVVVPPRPNDAAVLVDVASASARRSFSPANLEVQRGARLRWRFTDDTWHDITVADGPVGFSSQPMRRGGRFERRLTQPGTYKLFCSLHPVSMTQTVTVR